jgi:hypothetical protein
LVSTISLWELKVKGQDLQILIILLKIFVVGYIKQYIIHMPSDGFKPFNSRFSELIYHITKYFGLLAEKGEERWSQTEQRDLQESLAYFLVVQPLNF